MVQGLSLTFDFYNYNLEFVRHGPFVRSITSLYWNPIQIADHHFPFSSGLQVPLTYFHKQLTTNIKKKNLSFQFEVDLSNINMWSRQEQEDIYTRPLSTLFFFIMYMFLISDIPSFMSNSALTINIESKIL